MPCVSLGPASIGQLGGLARDGQSFNTQALAFD